MTKLRIHICPVGFEVDRIVQSAIKERAERIWLIVEKNRSIEKASNFIKKIETSLKKEKIETKEIGVAREDLFDNIRAIKEIFMQEKKNDIYVNVSCGSKIQAIACMMACMMFKEYEPKPYYVEPKNYSEKKVIKPQSYGVKNIFQLPTYEIQIPDQKLLKALKLISNNTGKITKKKLTKLCIEHDIIEVDKKDKDIDTGDFAKLESHVIKKLKDVWHYVNVERVGRNQVITLTEAGKHALLFLSHDESR